MSAVSDGHVFAVASASSNHWALRPGTAGSSWTPNSTTIQGLLCATAKALVSVKMVWKDVQLEPGFSGYQL